LTSSFQGLWIAYLDIVPNFLVEIDLAEMDDALLVHSANDDVNVGGTIRVVAGEIGVEVNGAVAVGELPASKVAAGLPAVLAH
jgi:hypothetical protein